MSRIKRFVQVLRMDTKRYVTKFSLKSIAITYLSSPGFRLVVLIRISSLFYSSKYWPVLNHFFQVRMLRYGAEIAPSAQLGPGLKIIHTIGIVIGGGVVVGANATILHGVTIGERRVSNNSDGKYPNIGDRVIIGNSSTILGDIEIGNDVKIASNSIILNNVQENTIVKGIH